MKIAVKTNRYNRVGLFLFFLFIPYVLYSAEFNVDGIWYRTLDTSNKNEVTVIQGFYSGDIIIPSEVTYGQSKYKVVSINKGAFRECRNLTSVKLPNTLTTIGDNSFYLCVSLTKIEISNSVTIIGSEAFAYCI